VLLIAVAGGCAGVGGPKPGAPAHHREGGFANLNPAFRAPSAWEINSFRWRLFWASVANRDIPELPRADNDGRALRENGSEATVTWVGHATLLVQLEGVNLLTDPQWSERASPVSFAGPKRFMAPGLRFEDLPPIHVVLISHDHYDHLDVATVQRLAREHRPFFLVPLGLKAWFAAIGIGEVEELDWWDSRTFRGLVLTCVPAQHWSARAPWDRDRRLWSGWAVAGDDRRFFFSGDTGYYDGFREVGARLGPFDLAAVSVGAYVPASIMQFTHTTPEQALQVFADVRGDRFIPIHWGTFRLSEEPLDEPPRRVIAESERIGLPADRVWIMKHGETRRW
jgi:L-ascorbate metabolism protein UlaG (beta-lactamase superfamily)